MNKEKKYIDTLKRYFSAFQFFDIQIINITDEFITGKIFYNRSIDDEVQEIKWDLKNYPELSEDALKLADLLCEYKLIDIDKIIINRSDLLLRYNKKSNSKLTIQEFNKTIEELLSFNIYRVDKGNNVLDSFFIHE
jgi:hypothetical protein